MCEPASLGHADGGRGKEVWHSRRSGTSMSVRRQVKLEVTPVATLSSWPWPRDVAKKYDQERRREDQIIDRENSTGGRLMRGQLLAFRRLCAATCGPPPPPWFKPTKTSVSSSFGMTKSVTT